ncbi:2'-5' RNA ligase [Legionella norrlandica]|uniref:RNA 2',3'-cyclic phosphodiesterase n=1 Tax=Legionella norrlandica TaxID=1498499 RepID=A0A0A2SUD8_9GAMM|nr:RNA 2',3'-cyclic phosphodiesterase [Legionella norrlandica]KGP63331.1 2'-5' RNA ligase [Legionella norrlandica]
MKAIRAFFAVALPQSIQKNIWSVLEPLRNATPANLIRWTTPTYFHITLQFLQRLEIDHIQALTDGVHKVFKNKNKFYLELGTLEWFPASKKPRLISLSVGPQDILRDLSAGIGQVISGLNYPVESRPFRGHLTIGRVVNHNVMLQQLLPMELPIIPPVLIEEFYLIESKPGKEGSNYFPLAQFPLQ